ncbi:MAG: LPS export ABC transporter periplasmic protein LptC [Campylobacterales bacterium]|nr:LPS export ABC transporter periplasmic protein LptC [Campylobacterales bacterium]
MGTININVFFLFITSSLMMIFFLFEPLNIREQNFIDVPLFEMSSFTLLEFDDKNLITLMTGNNAVRYSDRYKVANIDYTDNSKGYRANMKASDGLYQNEIIDLKGDVVYTREDGLIFKSQTADYNNITKIAHTNSDYVSYQGKNRVVGSSLTYNNVLKKIESKNIVANYQLEER